MDPTLGGALGSHASGASSRASGWGRCSEEASRGAARKDEGIDSEPQRELAEDPNETRGFNQMFGDFDRLMF